MSTQNHADVIDIATRRAAHLAAQQPRLTDPTHAADTLAHVLHELYNQTAAGALILPADLDAIRRQLLEVAPTLYVALDPDLRSHYDQPTSP